MSETRVVDISRIVGRGYRAFWESKHRYRVLKGGKASKKSSTMALWSILNIMRYEGANMLVVRNVYNTMRDSCFAQLKWAIKRLEVDDYWKATENPLELRYLPTGQKIIFRGFDDPDKLASTTVESGYLCWVWVEEAFEIASEEAFVKFDLSVPRGNVPPPLFKQTIAWYMWDISVSGVEWVYTMAREDQMVLLGVSGDNFVYYVLDEEADFDHVNPRIEGYDIVVDDQKVTYSFQTKQFDFGAMERLKTINSVYIWSGESTEAVITYILERGEMQDVNAFLPVSGVSRKTPSISRERTFGMRIEGEGNAEFSGIVINYKMMGGVR